MIQFSECPNGYTRGLIRSDRGLHDICYRVIENKRREVHCRFGSKTRMNGKGMWIQVGDTTVGQLDLATRQYLRKIMHEMPQAVHEEVFTLLDALLQGEDPAKGENDA